MSHLILGVLMISALPTALGCFSVRMESDPPGAIVYYNGKEVGQTPVTQTFGAFQNVNAVGEVVLPGFSRSDCPQLQVPSPSGMAVLTTAPPGAIIYKNGHQIGISPMYDTPDYPSALGYRIVWPKEVLAKVGYEPTRGRTASTSPVIERLPVFGSEKPGRVAVAKDCWSVVIGIADYGAVGQGGLSRLNFADKDARDFAATLKANGWSEDHIKLLTNTEATKQNIEYALETWLKKARQEDLILLYWSGHGWPDPEDPEKAYFACYNSKPSDPSSAFRMDRVRQILAERNPRNVMVIADTCHSGKVIRSADPRGVSIGPALESMKKREDIPKGWIFIASAEADRKAYEDKAWSNGALTHVLLEGLRDGKADGYQSSGVKDGVVTMAELRAYITDRMREESVNVIGGRLDPLFYTTSGDPSIWNLTLKAKQ